MIRSMTGYGKATIVYEGKKIIAEIRALNSKNLDLSLRVCTRYHDGEMEYRRILTPLLIRGKVDAAIWVEETTSQSLPVFNSSHVAAYAEQIRRVSDETKLPMPADPWSIIVRLPEVVQTQTTEDIAQEEWDAVRTALTQAATQLNAFRLQEGEALQHKFTEKLTNIARLMKAIEPYEQQRTERIRQRLEERLAELTGIDYDRGRLEQEMIFYIEKLDISEEKQRLANHLTYFQQTMDNEEAQGKKLGFIAQEMGREINTTGSKSNQAEMQNLVVQMKDELEQIKEQVLNVL
ncbi:MAG: YicC family protein [Bacteroidaceae bacterium]|nr:YicC family protein [Bacteroidaceae bacterium]